MSTKVMPLRKSHLVLITSVKEAPFKCKDCKKIFISGPHLERHVERRHLFGNDNSISSSPLQILASSSNFREESADPILNAASRIESLLSQLQFDPQKINECLQESKADEINKMKTSVSKGINIGRPVSFVKETLKNKPFNEDEVNDIEKISQTEIHYPINCNSPFKTDSVTLHKKTSHTSQRKPFLENEVSSKGKINQTDIDYAINRTNTSCKDSTKLHKETFIEKAILENEGTKNEKISQTEVNYLITSNSLYKDSTILHKETFIEKEFLENEELSKEKISRTETDYPITSKDSAILDKEIFIEKEFLENEEKKREKVSQTEIDYPITSNSLYKDSIILHKETFIEKEFLDNEELSKEKMSQTEIDYPINHDRSSRESVKAESVGKGCEGNDSEMTGVFKYLDKEEVSAVRRILSDVSVGILKEQMESRLPSEGLEYSQLDANSITITDHPLLERYREHVRKKFHMKLHSYGIDPNWDKLADEIAAKVHELIAKESEIIMKENPRFLKMRDQVDRNANETLERSIFKNDI